MFFKYARWIVVFILILSTGTYAVGNFYAYYTKLAYEDGISGPYADIVVSYGDKGDFIFSRESGFLPCWQNESGQWYVDELVERSGDGDAKRPDKNNIYSYVRLIEESDENILIHWRYIPDFNNPEFTGVVHEYFSLKPDGNVTRMVKRGDGDIVDYMDENNAISQTFKLASDGLSNVETKNAMPSKDDLPPIEGNNVIDQVVVQPVLWWKFDEGIKTRDYERRNITVEAVSKTECNIDGNLTLWKPGVSGSALAFDGYYSATGIAPDAAPDITGSYTIEAWVALGAYPWEWAPVIDLTDENGDGIYFGINSIGQFGCRVLQGGVEAVVKSNEEIQLHTWTHVAAIVDNEKADIKLYVDGFLVNSEKLTAAYPFPKSNGILIGLNKQQLAASDHVSRDYTDGGRTPLGNQPRIYGIEGLIDEVKIYDKALSYEEMNKSFTALNPDKEIKHNADLERRILPGHVDGNNAEKFGAYYTSLKYHELWDNLWRSSPYCDIVVRFDELPANVVYWRGPNYGPGWVTETNIWMSDQSCEIYHEYGCAEHMADKQNRHSHVRLLENHDARVVVHWRYASIDILYQFENDRIWADEYHYIYPDGTAIRFVTYHDEEIPGWQDVQFFAEAGTTPEDQIDLQALTVMNLDGAVYKMDWTVDVPDNKLEDAIVSIVNFKADYKVLVIYPEGDEIGAWGHIERANDETHFAGPWNHWPVGQMPNDGRYAMRTDRVTHSALGGAGPRDRAIYGFTNKDITELLPLARFWNRSPEMVINSGAENAEFKTSEKAYVVKANDAVVDFTIKASEGSPLYNPAFEIKDWNSSGASVKIDGKEIKEDKDCRIGYRNTKNGNDLIVWLRMNETVPVNISFTKQ